MWQEINYFLWGGSTGIEKRRDAAVEKEKKDIDDMIYQDEWQISQR